jgi:hypothetical protein
MDETYRKAKQMDKDSFNPLLVPDSDITDLVKIVRNYLLEGTDSNRKIKVELEKLNVYSMPRPLIYTQQKTKSLPSSGVILQGSRRYSTQQKHVRNSCRYLSSASRGRYSCLSTPRRRMDVRLFHCAVGCRAGFDCICCIFQ